MNRIMVRTAIVAISILGIVSCKENDGTTQPGSETSQAAPAVPVEKLCFAFSGDNDLIGLTLEIQGDQVRGSLAYALDGMDRSSGTIRGIVRSDTVFVDYTYIDKGMRVIRETAFLHRDNVLVEAQSDVVERDGRKVFRDRSALRFPVVFPLKNVPCEKPG